MVKLAPSIFADAASQMRFHSGVEKTRLMMKLRHRGGVIALKATDGSVTLTTAVRNQSELKVVEKVVHDFVAASTALAPVGDAAKSKGGKAGKKKK
jgi:hypothetical protein